MAIKFKDKNNTNVFTNELAMNHYEKQTKQSVDDKTITVEKLTKEITDLMNGKSMDDLDEKTLKKVNRKLEKIERYNKMLPYEIMSAGINLQADANKVLHSKDTVTYTSQVKDYSSKANDTLLNKIIKTLNDKGFFNLESNKAINSVDNFLIDYTDYKGINMTASIGEIQKIHDRVNKMINAKQGVIHSIDTETLGATSATNVWKPSFVTEFAKVTTDLSKPGQTTKTNILLTGDIYDQEYKRIMEALEGGAAGQKRIMSDPSLRVSMERFVLYGHDKTVIDYNAILGYSQVKSIADAEDIKSIYDKDLIKKGYYKLKNAKVRTDTITINNKDIKIKADVKQYIDSIAEMQKSIVEGKGVINGYNINKFDFKTINSSLQKMIKEDSTGNLLEYAKLKFGVNDISQIGLNNLDGSVVDMQNLARAYTGAYGNKSLVGEEIFNRIHGQRVNRQEYLGERYYADLMQKASHAALADTEVVHAMLLSGSQELNGESLFEHMFKGLQNANYYSTDITKNNILIANKGSMFNSDRNVLDFVTDLSNNVYFSSGHSIVNGNLKHDNINVSPFNGIKKNNLYSIDGMFTANTKDFYSDLGIDLPEYSSGDLHIVKLKAFRGDDFGKGHINEGYVYKVFNSKEEATGFIQSNFSNVGAFDENGVFKLNADMENRIKIGWQGKKKKAVKVDKGWKQLSDIDKVKKYANYMDERTVENKAANFLFGDDSAKKISNALDFLDEMRKFNVKKTVNYADGTEKTFEYSYKELLNNPKSLAKFYNSGGLRGGHTKNGIPIDAKDFENIQKMIKRNIGFFQKSTGEQTILPSTASNALYSLGHIQQLEEYYKKALTSIAQQKGSKPLGKNPSFKDIYKDLISQGVDVDAVFKELNEELLGNIVLDRTHGNVDKAIQAVSHVRTDSETIQHFNDIYDFKLSKNFYLGKKSNKTQKFNAFNSAEDFMTIDLGKVNSVTSFINDLTKKYTSDVQIRNENIMYRYQRAAFQNFAKEIRQDRRNHRELFRDESFRNMIDNVLDNDDFDLEDSVQQLIESIKGVKKDGKNLKAGLLKPRYDRTIRVGRKNAKALNQLDNKTIEEALSKINIVKLGENNRASLVENIVDSHMFDIKQIDNAYFDFEADRDRAYRLYEDFKKRMTATVEDMLKATQESGTDVTFNRLTGDVVLSRNGESKVMTELANLRMKDTDIYLQSYGGTTTEFHEAFYFDKNTKRIKLGTNLGSEFGEHDRITKRVKEAMANNNPDILDVINQRMIRNASEYKESTLMNFSAKDFITGNGKIDFSGADGVFSYMFGEDATEEGKAIWNKLVASGKLNTTNIEKYVDTLKELDPKELSPILRTMTVTDITTIMSEFVDRNDPNAPAILDVLKTVAMTNKDTDVDRGIYSTGSRNVSNTMNLMDNQGRPTIISQLNAKWLRYDKDISKYDNFLLDTPILEDELTSGNILKKFDIGLNEKMVLSTDFVHNAAQLGTMGLETTFSNEMDRVLKEFKLSSDLDIKNHEQVVKDMYTKAINTYVGGTFEQSRLVDSRMIDTIYGSIPQDTQKLSTLKDLDNALQIMKEDTLSGKAKNKVKEAMDILGDISIDEHGNVTYTKSAGTIVRRGEGLFKTSSAYGDQISPFASKFDTGILNFKIKTEEGMELTEKEISELLSKKIKQELQGKSAEEAQKVLENYKRPEGLFKLLLDGFDHGVKGTYEVSNVNSAELLKMGNSDKGMAYVMLTKIGSLSDTLKEFMTDIGEERFVGNNAISSEALAAYISDISKNDPEKMQQLLAKYGVNTAEELTKKMTNLRDIEQHELSRMFFSKQGIFKGEVSAVINDNYIGHKNFGTTNSATLARATELYGKYYGKGGNKVDKYESAMDDIVEMINNNTDFQFLQLHTKQGQMPHIFDKDSTVYFIENPLEADIDQYSSFNQESFNKLIEHIDKKLEDAGADINDRMIYKDVYAYDKNGKLVKYDKIMGNLRTVEKEINGEKVRIVTGLNSTVNSKMYNDSEVQSYISKDFLLAQETLQQKKAELARLKDTDEKDLIDSLKNEINDLEQRIFNEEPYSKRIKIDDQYRNILSAYKLDSVMEDDYNKAIKQGRINQKFIDAAREFMIQDDKGNWKFKEDLKSDNVYHGFLENIRGLMTYDPTKEQKLTKDMLQDEKYAQYADLYKFITEDMNMELGVESAQKIHGIQGAFQSYHFNDTGSHTLEKNLVKKYGYENIDIADFASSFGKQNNQLDALVGQGYIVNLGEDFNNIKVAVPGMGSYAGDQEIRKEWQQKFNSLSSAWEEYNNYIGDTKNTDNTHIDNLKGRILNQVNEIKEASNRMVSKQGDLGMLSKIEANMPYTRTKLFSMNDMATVRSWANTDAVIPLSDAAEDAIKSASFKSKAMINGKTIAEWEKGGLKNGVYFDYGVAGIGEFERMGFFNEKVLKSMNMNRTQMEDYLEQHGTMELVNRYPNIIDRSVQNVRMFLDKDRPDNGVSIAEWTMRKMNGDSDGDAASKMLIERHGVNYTQFDYNRQMAQDYFSKRGVQASDEEIKKRTVSNLMSMEGYNLTQKQANEIFDQMRGYEASTFMETTRNIDAVAEDVLPTLFKDESKNFRLSGGIIDGKPAKGQVAGVYVEGMTNVGAQIEGGKSILGKIRVTNLQKGPGHLDEEGGSTFLIDNTKKLNSMLEDVFKNKDELIKTTGVNFDEYTHLNNLFTRVSNGEGNINIHNFKYGEEQHQALDELLSLFEKDKATGKPILSTSLNEAQDTIINRIRADIYNQTATGKSNKGVIGEVNAALYSIRQAAGDVLGSKTGDNQASFVNGVLQKVGYELEEHVISSKKAVFEPGDTRLKNVSEFISKAKLPQGTSLESTKSDVSSWIYDYMSEGKINEIYQQTIGRSSGAPSSYSIEQVNMRAKAYFQSASGMLTQEQATAKAQADMIGEAFVTGIHNLNNDEEGRAAIKMYGIFGRRSGTIKRMHGVNMNDTSKESFSGTAYRIASGQKVLEKVNIPEPSSIDPRNIQKPRINDVKSATRELKNIATDVLSNVSSSGIALGVLGLAAGLMISGYASGNPLKDPKNDNMENQPQEIKNTPLPTFFNEQDGYAQNNPQQQGYIINIKADSRRGQRYTKKAMKQAVEASVGGGVNINMNFKSNNSGGFSQSDIENIINNYLS